MCFLCLLISSPVWKVEGFSTQLYMAKDLTSEMKPVVHLVSFESEAQPYPSIIIEYVSSFTSLVIISFWRTLQFYGLIIHCTVVVILVYVDMLSCSCYLEGICGYNNLVLGFVSTYHHVNILWISV